MISVRAAVLWLCQGRLGTPQGDESPLWDVDSEALLARWHLLRLCGLQGRKLFGSLGAESTASANPVREKGLAILS